MDLLLPPDFKEFLKLLKEHDVRYLHEEKIRKNVQWQEKQEKQAEAVQGKLFD